jgi:phosphatidyl-myo-inositol dimannoside synthase
MERFNQRVLEQLALDSDVALCGPQGCEAYVPEATLVRSVSIRSLPLFFLRCAWNSLLLAGKFKPDVIVAGSGLTAPLALALARIFRVPCLVFVYGLDLVVDSLIYQRLWMPTVRACAGVIAISSYTRGLALSRGIPEGRLEVITPGVDSAHQDPAAVSRFRIEHGLDDRPLMISLGRMTRRKGLLEFIDQCLPSIVAARKDALLVYIGGEQAATLVTSRTLLGQEALRRVAALGLEDNFRMLGMLPDDSIPAALQASHVHVFPILELPGDVEGFGIVALEAASNGTPTVAFAVGGVPDAVGPGQSGELIEQGDYAGMTRAILAKLCASDEARLTTRHACIAFSREFEWERIGKRLNALVGRFLEQKPEATK